MCLKYLFNRLAGYFTGLHNIGGNFGYGPATLESPSTPVKVRALGERS